MRGVSFIVSSFSTPHAAYRRLRQFIGNLAVSLMGLGASLIGVEDSAGYLTADDMEGALEELAQVANSTSALTDPGNAGAIPVTRSGCVPIVTAAGETRTLAIPRFINQRITLFFKTDGGDCVITVAAAINQAGNTIVTLDDVEDSLQLVAVNNGVALVWRVSQNDGCTLS